MNILHFYPQSDDMITRHVSVLTAGLRYSAEVQSCSNISDLKQKLQQSKPDIIHLHGCWQYAHFKAAAIAGRRHIRYILSPHGQLEPWIVKDRASISDDSKSPTALMGRSVILQRRTAEHAFALIAFGKMESKYLTQLGWNPRIEIIHNTVTTNSISPEEMCRQTLAIYQKVMDSNVLEQMSDNDRQLLSVIIKAGITGDARWTSPPGAPERFSMPDTTHPDWRRILIYAEHQNIRNYVDYGINILGLHGDFVDTEHVASYFPPRYKRPQPLKELIGKFSGDETDYLIRILRQLQGAPLLLHLIELHRELRRDNVDEDKLVEALEEKRLTAFAGRLMQILSEQTLLDEGYMPLDPLDDRGTRQIRNLIANHLRI